MKSWMLPFVFPVGLIGSVVFVVVFNPYEALLSTSGEPIWFAWRLCAEHVWPS
jgi:hypothetical protein